MDYNGASREHTVQNPKLYHSLIEYLLEYSISPSLRPCLLLGFSACTASGTLQTTAASGRYRDEGTVGPPNFGRYIKPIPIKGVLPNGVKVMILGCTSLYKMAYTNLQLHISTIIMRCLGASPR